MEHDRKGGLIFADMCVICGCYVPEGAMICTACQEKMENPFSDLKIDQTDDRDNNPKDEE